jgi:hypothetical protein
VSGKVNVDSKRQTRRARRTRGIGNKIRGDEATCPVATGTAIKRQ